MNHPSKGIALVTGASSGIGAIYADRLARRGFDLILVARNLARLESLARRLESETGRTVEVIAADLYNTKELAKIEAILQQNARVTMLVNNAGVASNGPLLATGIETVDAMISLNVTAVAHLAYAAAPAFVKRGGGTIINISSVLGLTPEVLNGVYGGTKAFVLALSQSLHKELSELNVRIQVVLPGATATDLWEKAGAPLSQLPVSIVMQPDDLVDAALAGLDQGEFITIPSLPDTSDWTAYEAARQKLMPNLSLNKPAERYLATTDFVYGAQA